MEAEDLLWHLPRAYQAIRQDISIAAEGETVVVCGSIAAVRINNYRPPYRATLLIPHGTIELVWFSGSRAYLAENFAVGAEMCLQGVLRSYRGNLTITHPKILKEAPPEGVLPLYPLTEGITQDTMREIFIANRNTLLDKCQELLPSHIVKRYRLPGLRESLEALHFPNSQDEKTLQSQRSRYHKRLIFQEIVLFELGRKLVNTAQRLRSGKAIATQLTKIVPDIEQKLGFPLTGGQLKVLEEIERDLQSSLPMNRLLQGDVGSGKTAVALTAMASVVQQGLQCVLMAPTEVLANQHFRLFATVLDEFCQVGLLTGSMRKKEREQAYRAITDGSWKIVIGTHALFTDGVDFSSLGLCVIDEQHRFGVEQRAALGRRNPGVNQLYMSATPIPRTLALTVFGEMPISSLQTVPFGRKPVMTRYYQGKAQYKRILQEIQQQLEEGGSIYIVAPLIEESESLDLADATRIQLELQKPFGTFGVELLHGKISSEARNSIMDRFTSGQSRVLVATTVIEVGVDNPNANYLVIYHPERFGLSQLHQLRGRVGRGYEQGHCVLYSPKGCGSEARERIAVLLESQDGFHIAQQDLQLRGPGQLLGVRQWGMPEFTVADPVRDTKAWEFARLEVAEIINSDPALTAPENRQLRDYFTRKQILTIVH